MSIIKRNGEAVAFDGQKIIDAIRKANEVTEKKLTEAQIEDIADYIEFKYRKKDVDLTIEEIQDMVEDQLMQKSLEVGKCYVRYRASRMDKHEIVEPKNILSNKELLKDLKIRKKNGVLEAYSADKIIAAVLQSAARAREKGNLTEGEKNTLITLVERDLARKVKEENVSIIPTKVLHILIERYLNKCAPDVGQAYTNYHSFRMHQAKTWERVMGQCTTLLSTKDDDESLGAKNQNANADSTLSSTRKAFFGDYVAEEYYNNFFLTQEEKSLTEAGYVYIHDKNGRMIYSHNCCLFRMDYVLEHGCTMNGITYNKPQSLDTCFDVMGDLILMSASQQYGGFTVPRIDSVVAPYAEKSYEKFIAKYESLGLTKEKAEEQAYLDVKECMLSGFQGLELKLNTVASSRGDYPFTTISFGLDTSRFGKLASICALETRKNGQGEKGKKKPVLFPKLVFLYDKELHGKGKELEDVFEAGIECSSKTMYPDWLSLTGEGYVPSMYKNYGIDGVISPMGCRAFLSPWYERGGMEPADEDDKVIFEGRFNLGVISLNLPMILAKSRKDNTDFYDELDYMLNIIRNNHKRTYEYLSNLKASLNPTGFCYGGFYGGNLKPEDKIAPVLKSSTMSFGVTALNELQMLYNGKSLVEDGAFALEVMEHINEKISEFKKEDNILYAIYGTPAENLSGKQVKQFRALYGIVPGVSDRDYVSNSFHCHVTEKISPIQKQDLENRFWNLFNGGKIQYCRYPLGYNIEAIRSLVLRAMELGFYEGVNISLCFCDDCGYSQPEIGDSCPICSSPHITQIDRMNGYLSFTRVGQDTRELTDENGNHYVVIHSRFSPHMQKNIRDRVSM